MLTWPARLWLGPLGSAGPAPASTLGPRRSQRPSASTHVPFLQPLPRTVTENACHLQELSQVCGSEVTSACRRLAGGGPSSPTSRTVRFTAWGVCAGGGRSPPGQSRRPAPRPRETLPWRCPWLGAPRPRPRGSHRSEACSPDLHGPRCCCQCHETRHDTIAHVCRVHAPLPASARDRDRPHPRARPRALTPRGGPAWGGAAVTVAWRGRGGRVCPGLPGAGVRAWRSRDGACGLCLAVCESRPQPPRSAVHVQRPDPARRCWVLAPGRCDGSAGASASAVEEAAAPLHPLPPAHADRGAGPSGHRGGRPCPLRKESACTAHGRRCPPRLTLPPGDLLVLARKLFFFTAAYYSACSLPQLT